jgi:hypothetical protein
MEFFTFLHLKFNITEAKKKAAKYEPEKKAPSLDWLLPLIYIDPVHVLHADLLKVVIFASLPIDKVVCHYLIDGNHTVSRAVADGVATVNVVTLSIADSLFILKSKKSLRDSIRAEARTMGLL